METFSYQGHQLIAINHEYANRRTNLPEAQDGTPANADDVLKFQNLQGVVVLEMAEGDDGFDTSVKPNEPHRAGWIIEIDPTDPTSTPVKHTGLGRFKHENAAVTLADDGRVVV